MGYEGSFIIAKVGDEERRLKHGEGIMRWQDGRQYQGQFAFDKMHGEGCMSWPDGAKYVGGYCDNAKAGNGKLTLPDSSSFEGIWHKGVRHGEILYIDADGNAFCFEYDEDRVVRQESIPAFDGWTLKPGYDVFINEDQDQHSDVVCCICLCKMSEGDICCKTPCNHVFHQECIAAWTRRKYHCPLCLQRIPLRKFYEETEDDVWCDRLLIILDDEELLKFISDPFLYI